MSFTGLEFHSGDPYRDELQVAVAAAREAGADLLHRSSSGFSLLDKADRTTLTDADLASEQILLSHLRSRFPHDGVLSEEAGQAAQGERTWVLDPLDGTTNFSRGLPFFAVSVGLLVGSEPAVAAIYLPKLGELFTATRGGVACLNGRPIRVSPLGDVAQAMVNVYFDRRNALEQGLELHRRIALTCEGRVKTMGSTASMLCYVACGRLDAFARSVTKIFDFVAGLLIVERAGGRVTDFTGMPLRRTGQSILATNGHLHPVLQRAARGGELGHEQSFGDQESEGTG